MQYSDFSLEQLKQNRYFDTMCDLFLNLAKDQDTLTKLKCILYQGGYQHYSASINMQCKDNPDIEMQRRFALAYLLIKNPETFQFFVDHKINLFHGTNANALPSILKYGLKSANKIKEQEIEITTGEEWSRIQGRDFISFTDVYDIAEEYSELTSENGKEYLSFEAILGTTEEDVQNCHVVSVGSDISEIGVLGEVPLETIKCICVPDSQVEYVKSMMKDDTVPVLAMPNPKDKFYYIENGEVAFYQALYEKMLHGEPLKTEKRFSLKEIEELSKTRIFSHIKSSIEKFKQIFKESEEKEVERIIK